MFHDISSPVITWKYWTLKMWFIENSMEFYWQLFSLQTFEHFNMLKCSSYILFLLLIVLRRLHFMIHFKIIILKWYCIIFWDKCYFDDVQGNKMKKKEMQKGKRLYHQSVAWKLKIVLYTEETGLVKVLLYAQTFFHMVRPADI